MFSNIRKITKEYLTKADVIELKAKYSSMQNISIKMRPTGKGILERVHADIIIAGTLAEQLSTIKAMRA